MRRCPLCKLALRGNDPSSSIQVPPDNPQGARPGFYVGVCYECFRGNGGFIDVVEIWVGPETCTFPGRRPEADGTYDAVPPGLCAVCKRCAREDDQMHGLRLWREDLSPEDAARLVPEGQEQAHYMACGDCRNYYALPILCRLKRQKLVPEELTIGQMGPPHFV